MLADAQKREVVLTPLEKIEYNLILDGVIEIPVNVDKESFFDGLLNTLIEYAEKYDSVAGISMEYRKAE